MPACEMSVMVWRGGVKGAFQRFEVPRQAIQTVLNVVVWIQQNADPSLAYRYACRVGMCGACAMTVNGTPRLTCHTHMQKVVNDGRLPGFQLLTRHKTALHWLRRRLMV